jgi:hypothetical protein
LKPGFRKKVNVPKPFVSESTSERYASYRRSPGSSTTEGLLFMAHLCSFADGIGGGGLEPSSAEGRRKGRAPLGEAWLLEDAIWCSIPENLRYAYNVLVLRSLRKL